MNEEMMTTGFTGGDAATGPTAGFDPVLGKFRRKLKKRRSKEEKKLVMPGNKLSEADMTGAPSIKDAKPIKSTPVKNYPGLGIAPTIAGLKKASKGGKIKKEETKISESSTSTSKPPDPLKGVMTGDPEIKGAPNKVSKTSAKLSKNNEKKPEKILDKPENKIKESRENPTFPSRLFQYKVSIPEVGETIIYANSLAELTQKMRLLVNPRYRGDIKIERIMPGKAAQFFMDKRMKHMKNIKEEESKDAKEQADDKIRAAKKKVLLRKQEMQKQLATKTRQLKRAAAAGQAPAEDS